MTNQELWAERVAEWQASGVSVYRFAQDRDFSRSQLYCWIRKLREDQEPSPATPEIRFARVATAPPLAVEEQAPGNAAVDDTASAASPPVLVDVGHARVTVPAGASRALFEMVLDVVLHRCQGEAR
jgi:transposase-like protein